MVDEIERARSALQSLSPNVGRAEWIKIGMAAHAAGLSLQDFMEFSRPGATFNESACKAAWRSFKNNSASGITAATLFGMARDAGWTDDGTPGKPTAKPPKAVKTPPEPPREPAPGKSAAEVWARAMPLTMPTHPYLVRKQAAGVPLGNLRGLPQDDSLTIAGQSMAGALVVPAMTIDGSLQSLQLIPPLGQKMNLPGCPISGALHIVGELVSGGVAYVCEGIGQAWAVWQATGHAAVCCFGWGNVHNVTHQLRRDNPGMALVLVLDRGKENAAQELAREVNATLVYMPQDKPDNYDAWDYARDYGVTELERLLLEQAQLPPAPTTPETSASTKVEQVVETVEIPAPEGESWLSQLNVVFADDVSYAPPDELVEGVLVSEKTSVLYGDSNSGKTFLAIDIAAAVARGIDWQGRRTEQGAVLYLACEAPQSVLNRLAAYRQHHNCVVPSFAVVKRPVNFFQSEVDACAVAELVHEIERTGQKVRLVVVDTLARVSSGANENSGEDMGPVMARVDWIREKCHVHVLVIHHCGKNAAAGSRGWSGIRAAIDTEIEVSESVAGRVAEITKERDLGSKGTRLGFRLEPVTLGTTKWGAPSTTCIVVADDAPAAKPTKRMGECEGAVVEYLASKKVGVRKADVVKHFESRYDRGNVYRAIRSLVSIGAAHEGAGLVCIASAATQQS